MKPSQRASAVPASPTLAKPASPAHGAGPAAAARPRRHALAWAAALGAAAAAGGCGMFGDEPAAVSERPAYVGTATTLRYDGISDDLLTAGFGKSGLPTATGTPADPANPSAAELRKLAILSSYRAIVDTTAAGGYGLLYGPNVGADGLVGTGEGKIAGTETLAYSDDGSGQRNVVLLVQVPDSFNPAAPCILTATSSGSRGVYGAISTGEWGLKRGCAVAYTDKGTGGAPHDLANDTVARIDGTRGAAAQVGTAAHFRAGLDSSALAALNAATPNRFAFKHAHSQRNPEKDWGLFTLQAVQFAFWVLNERYSPLQDDGQRQATIRPDNTLVIASSVSNGGGAAIAAAELDRGQLIDGVAVAEPAIEMPANPAITVRRGSTAPLSYGKTLVDFSSHANVYQACAALSASLAGAPYAANYAAFFGALAGGRCQSLKDKGLISGNTTAELADAALAKLQAYGWEAESVALHASLAAFEVAPAVTVTFANALARASVADHLCGYSFGATTAAGVPAALATVAPTALAAMAATGNGVPPAGGVQLINNLSLGAPLRDLYSFSPSTARQDMNLDGALCLRNLLTGTGSAAKALQAGVDETRRNGQLGGRPAIIVHGRDDALLPVNHTSRPYTALNKVVEGSASQLSYIEVTHAQHFDSFIGLPAVLPGYDSRYVPLHVYLNRALDAVWARLKNGTPLPPSQVVRTLPRGGTPGAAPAITAAHVPAIAASPAAADAITMSGSTLVVPD